LIYYSFHMNFLTYPKDPLLKVIKNSQQKLIGFILYIDNNYYINF
jgi:hypothetical protein